MPCPPASGVQNQLTDGRLRISQKPSSNFSLSNIFSNAMSASAVCRDLLYARSSASAVLCAMKGCLVDAQARGFPPREAPNQMTHLQRSSGSSPWECSSNVPLACTTRSKMWLGSRNFLQQTWLGGSRCQFVRLCHKFRIWLEA